MPVLTEIDDAEWFELQFDPARAKEKYDIILPSFPDDATQISFTGRCGRPNLQVAFGFYLYARSVSGTDKLRNPRVMDFGAGWGRIARLFLREARPKDIFASDTMGFAIRCLQETGGVFQIVQNPPAPPIPGFDQTFDLIYAYSVFSHLSESYTRAWLDYLLTLLRPGGHLIFTTRDGRFITDLRAIKAQPDDYVNSQKAASANEYLQVLRRTFPDPAIIEDRFAAGEFQFYPVGHAELPEDCTGETLIPRSYLERHYSRYLAAFNDDVPNVDQTVVVLKKPNTVVGLDAERTNAALTQKLGDLAAELAALRLAALTQKLGEREAESVALVQKLGERDAESVALVQKLGERDAESAAAHASLNEAQTTLHQVLSSRSWKLTAPLRTLKRTLQQSLKPKADPVPDVAKPLSAQRNAVSSQSPAPAASGKTLGSAVSINKDFHSLEEFMAFAEANPIFFDDDIEQNVVRHCQIYGIHSTAMGICGPSEVAIIGPESREHLMVRGLNSRQRAVLEELHVFLENRKLPIDKARIYGHEAITPLALFLRGHFPKYLGTEFAHNETQKAELFPIQHGDICHSNFKSSTFDVIISGEVLEHVPSMDEALSESARILVDGGRFIGTMPFFYHRQDSQRFATMEDGKIKQIIEPPICHGDPMDPDGGVLVFEIPGWDLLDRARRAGFRRAAMRFICEQNKGIIATSVGEQLRAKGVFVAIFDK
jgi:2-polyprenyl-3-methyl-5-hydroxy-6-metoxy-1,4-benzoquinol methylase